MRWIRGVTFTSGLLLMVSVNAHGQAPRQPRFDVSVFFSRGVTDDLWGFDASYRAKADLAVFGTLTVVDTVGVSGWMGDAGMRWTAPIGLFGLRASVGAGARVKRLTDANRRTTQLRGLTESRLSLPLGPVVPYVAVRYPWFDWKDVDSVWGISVVW